MDPKRTRHPLESPRVASTLREGNGETKVRSISYRNDAGLTKLSVLVDNLLSSEGDTAMVRDEQLARVCYPGFLPVDVAETFSPPAKTGR